jgi:DNA polymerase lambda
MSGRGRKRKAAEAPAPAPPPPAPPLFVRAAPGGGGATAPLRFLFLYRSHISVMVARIRERGGEVVDVLAPGVTHVVVDAGAAAADVLERLSAGAPAGAATGNLSRLLDGAEVVTPAFVARSLGAGRLEREEDHRPAFWAEARAAADGAAAERAPSPPQEEQQEEEEQRASPERALPTTPDAEPAPEEAATGEACVVERRGARWVAVRGRLPAATGGRSGLPWGFAGVWEEPVDEAAARETVERLRRAWYQHRGAAPPPPPPADAHGSAPRVAAAAAAPACGHAACGARDFCLVARLGEVRKAYSPGKADQFRIKALEHALAQLSAWPAPLNSEADVDAVCLGAKSADKVKEILRTGRSARADAAAADPRARALADFERVWGVGPATAERWHAAGCRALADVRVRAGELRLTAQQAVGLKFFDDFELRIPHAEIATAEAVVREAAFALAEELGAGDAERCFCAATGSYARGAPDSSDVDMLIALPPSLDRAGITAGAFAVRLLRALLEKGFLLDECAPGAYAPAGARASFLGVCRVPGGAPAARRIDFKVYQARAAPFAVNYFRNKEEFCRATRHWVNRAKAAARARHPQATGFRLTDAEIVPAARPRGEEERILGPGVPCRDETAIFELLGLNYVPVRMRHFGEDAP